MDPKTARQLVEALTFIKKYTNQRMKRCTSFVRAKLLLAGELQTQEAEWEQPLSAQELKTVEACVPVLKKAQESCDTAIRILSSERLPKGFDADALLEAIRKIQPNGADHVGVYETVKRTFVVAIDILNKHAATPHQPSAPTSKPEPTANVSSDDDVPEPLIGKRDILVVLKLPDDKWDYVLRLNKQTGGPIRSRSGAAATVSDVRELKEWWRRVLDNLDQFKKRHDDAASTLQNRSEYGHGASNAPDISGSIVKRTHGRSPKDAEKLVADDKDELNRSRKTKAKAPKAPKTS